MSDLKLTADGDLDITAGALTLVTGADAIAQQIKIALRLFKGEWFLSPTEGMPYFDKIFQKGVRPAAVESIFRRALLAIPGVLEVLFLELELDGATRQMSLDFEVRVEGSDTPLTFTEFVI